MFFPRIETLVRERKSLLVVGIDPHPELLPAATPEHALAFGLRLAEATLDYAVAFKVNTAFFEALGEKGWAVLVRLVQELSAHLPVILDAKRGDVPSTARAYARGVFETLPAAAVTLSPFLGRDALEPFLAHRDRGIFLLIRTSNPGADAVQEQPLATGEPLYLALARWAASWAEAEQVGFVVGATQPQALAQVRQVAVGFWFLAPGVGTQGGILEAAYRAGRRADGLGILFPLSRTLARAENPTQAARDLQERTWALVQEAAQKPALPPLPEPLRVQVARLLVETGCVRFGTFTLKSGQTAPIYFDLRRLVGYPEALAQVAHVYAALVRPLHVDRLAALPYAALPLGSAVAVLFGFPLIYPRKERKAYGTQAVVEGPFRPGERVAVLDDVLTTGASKREALETLRHVGLQVTDVVVLIDREAGGREALERIGLRVHAAFTLRELLHIWGQQNLVSGETLNQIHTWLQTVRPL